MFAEIDEIEDILLKTCSAKSDRRLQKFRGDSAVLLDDIAHFVHVGFGRLTKSLDRIDAGYALFKKGVGHEFGQFRRLECGRDDSVTRNPIRIN
jgi:hypothetical protein